MFVFLTGNDIGQNRMHAVRERNNAAIHATKVPARPNEKVLDTKFLPCSARQKMGMA